MNNLTLRDKDPAKIDRVEKSARAHGVPCVRHDATTIELDIHHNPAATLAMTAETVGADLCTDCLPVCFDCATGVIRKRDDAAAADERVPQRRN